MRTPLARTQPQEKPFEPDAVFSPFSQFFPLLSPNPFSSIYFRLFSSFHRENLYCAVYPFSRRTEKRTRNGFPPLFSHNRRFCRVLRATRKKILRKIFSPTLFPQKNKKRRERFP